MNVSLQRTPAHEDALGTVSRRCKITVGRPRDRRWLAHGAAGSVRSVVVMAGSSRVEVPDPNGATP
jgi:hypothetical protein